MIVITALLSIGSLWGKVWPFLVAVLYFGFLILAHELGHFGTAKAFRVRVNEFSLGMGPRLLKRKRGETLYSLKAVPFGGSVIMEGEDESTDDTRGFLNQKPWKRICILVAGAFINLLCGLLIMTILISTQGLVGTTKVHPEWKTAGQSGLRPGDDLRKINGKRVISNLDIGFLLSRDSDGTIDFVVRRDGKDVQLDGVTMEQLHKEDMKILGLDRSDFSKVKFAGIVAGESLRESVSVVRLVWLSLLDMVTGKFKLTDLSGPVGVVQIISGQAQEAQASAGDSKAFRAAIDNLLFLFALISINIGLMNLLPLPALDGGRIFFCLIEMIFRKPIPKRFEATLHAVGLLLLFAFMIIISFSDILAWVQGKR